MAHLTRGTSFFLLKAKPDLEKRQRELVAKLSSAELTVPHETKAIELHALLSQVGILLKLPPRVYVYIDMCMYV